MSISRQPLCSSKVIATMAATYQAFLTERDEHDCPKVIPHHPLYFKSQVPGDLVAEDEGERCPVLVDETDPLK
jgi:hypothetical protein